MEDEYIVSLYWKRDEAAIKETEKSTPSIFSKLPITFFQVEKMPKKASMTHLKA